MKFIASSARKGKHLICYPCEQDCRAGNFTCGPAENSKRATPLGVALVELLMYGCYSASW